MNDRSDLKALATFLDAKFRLPGGFRIGWDGILGFVPGAGDLVTNILSMYIIARAAAIGCPPAVLIRMGGNVLIDNVIDLVPVLGNFFDIFWKSNLKNIDLIERYSTQPHETTVGSKIAIGVTLVLIFAILIGSVVLVGLAAIWLVQQISDHI